MKYTKMVLVFMCLFIASVNAVEDDYNYKFDSGMPVSSEHMIGAYNAPCCLKLNGGWDIFANISFLYFQPKEQGLDLGLVQPTTNITDNHASVVNAEFDFDPAFRISLGTFCLADNWNLFLEYTRFYSNNRKEHNIVPATDSFVNYWDFTRALANYTYIHDKWTLHFNTLDLAFGRPYYVGTKLTFLPIAGIRLGFIDQKNVVKFTANSNFYETNVKSDSWLLGPRLGIYTNWLFGENFKLYGNAFASIFYQSFKLSLDQFQDLDPKVYSIRAKNSDNYINGDLELALGFSWGSYFQENRWYLEFSAGYEFNLFFNQNMLRSFFEELTYGISQRPGNLTPHGMVIGIKASF